MKPNIWILIALLILSLSGCKKSKENDIIGNWQKVSFRAEPDSVIVIWKFYENNEIVGSVLINGEEDTGSIVKGTYSIKRKKAKHVLTIDKEDAFILNEFDWRGVYAFVELNMDVMQLYRLEGWHYNAVTHESTYVGGGGVFLIADFVRY